MEEAWLRIVAWYGANTPPGTLRLPPGTTEEALQAAERRIGFKLPTDLRDFYRLHDGLSGKWLVHYGAFHSLAQLIAAWESHRKLEPLQRGRAEWIPVELCGAIRPAWWSTRRVLITNIGGTDGVMSDLDPAAGGTVGQLIEFNHEVGPRCVLAPSFTTWLQRIANGLEEGKFVCDPLGCEVVPRGYYERRESLGDWERRSAEPAAAPDPVT